MKAEGDAAQYELAKLHLPQAHTLAKGDNVLVAVIDSGIDATHPELTGAIVQSYDTLSSPMTPHKHGTAIAGLIAAHGKLMGAAPAAHILAIRAFDGTGASAEGTTFNILKGLDWAAANGARVINMSFAGPPDPALHRSLEAAHKKGIVLVAAAGNAGPKSPPLYPAADPNVIAVSATDADDRLFEQSNRGRHIAVAAPGEQILVAIPDGGYEVSSGHVLFGGGSQRHRRADARAQDRPHARQGARHPAGDRQGSRTQGPRRHVRRRTCRRLWRTHGRSGPGDRHHAAAGRARERRRALTAKKLGHTVNIARPRALLP